MDLSLFLAKVMGLLFLIYGIGMFAMKANLKAMVQDIVEHRGLLFIAGFTNLLLGVLIIVSHNIWQPNWRILITVLGWLILLRGIMVSFFPQIVIKNAHKFIDNNTAYYISTVVTLLIGLVLCYYGFFSPM